MPSDGEQAIVMTYNQFGLYMHGMLRLKRQGDWLCGRLWELTQ